MGVNPYHFNQVAGPNAYANLARSGQRVYAQPDRDYIAEGLSIAQADILPYLRTFHRPTFVYEEIPVPARWIPTQSLHLSYSWLDKIGKRAVELIQANVPVSYNLATGTASVTVTTAVEFHEIEVFFRMADGADGSADPLWEIEPLRRSVSAGTVTLTGHASLFVKPSLWRQPYLSPNYNEPNIGDSDNPSTYVTAVDVYRVYADASIGVEILSDPWWTGHYTTTVPDLRDGGLLIMDNRTSEVRLRYELCSLCHIRGARTLRVHYRAGFPLDHYTQRPNAALETAFIRLANCRIPQIPNSFDDIRAQVFASDQLVDTIGGENARPLSAETPFGYRRGEVAAWRTITSPPYAVGAGGVLGV
jgi:hypothetical protein